MADNQDQGAANAARERAWWARWRAFDYSWEGLASKPASWTWFGVPPRGEGSLQDYWARDPDTGERRSDENLLKVGELVRAPGVEGKPGPLWHIAHMPLIWADGTPAKSVWTREPTIQLASLVKLRLTKVTQTKCNDYGGAEGPDGRAQFRGVVLPQLTLALPTLSQDTAIHAVWANSWLESFDAKGHPFGPGAVFAGANFQGQAIFGGANFQGQADFVGANFQGQAIFAVANFQGQANFVGANFQRGAIFGGANFQREAIFADANFQGQAFLGSANFQGLASFVEASFQGPMNFRAALFENTAWFTNLTWPKEAQHWHSAFNAVRFKDFVSFRTDGGGAFRHFAAFDGAQFDRPLQFDEPLGRKGTSNAETAAEKDFRLELAGAREAGTADAEEWLKNEKRKIEEARKVQQQEREAAQKKQDGQGDAGDDTAPTAQNDAVIPRLGAQHEMPLRRSGAYSEFAEEKLGPVLAAHRSALRGTRDDQMGQAHRSAMRGALEDVMGQVHTTPLRSTRDDTAGEAHESRPRKRHPWFETGLLGMLADWADDNAYRAKLRDLEKEMPSRIAAAQSKSLRELERGCRVLKQEMGKQEDRTREQPLFRFELLSRRAQLSFWSGEHFASRAYEWFANFGAAIVRPLASVVAMMAVFAAIFLGLGYASGAQIADSHGTAIFESIDLSLSSTFRPFQAIEDQAGREYGTQTNENPRKDCIAEPSRGLHARSIADCLQSHSVFMRVGVRALAILQSLIAIVLVFLFALAVRRRFQIT